MPSPSPPRSPAIHCAGSRLTKARWGNGSSHACSGRSPATARGKRMHQPRREERRRPHAASFLMLVSYSLSPSFPDSRLPPSPQPPPAWRPRRGLGPPPPRTVTIAAQPNSADPKPIAAAHRKKNSRGNRELSFYLLLTALSRESGSHCSQWISIRKIGIVFSLLSMH